MAFYILNLISLVPSYCLSLQTRMYVLILGLNIALSILLSVFEIKILCS